MREHSYKFPGLSFGISFYDDAITIYLEDRGCYVNNEMEDTYSVTEYYEDVFWEKSLCDEDSILSILEIFCNYIDYKMRDMLPDFEEFDDYQEIEGYWECIGLVRNISREPLLKLWKAEKENQIDICKSIIEKISNGNHSFTSDELDLIKYTIREELSSLIKNFKE